MTRDTTYSSSATTNRPSTRASEAPVRTTAGSARPPTSRLIASTSIVLPAPVSPVNAVKPGCSTRSSASITPIDSMCNSWSISAIRQPELGFQDLVEATLAEANETGDRLRGTHDDRIAIGEACRRLPVDRQRRNPVAADLDLDLFVGVEHQ